MGVAKANQNAKNVSSLILYSAPDFKGENYCTEEAQTQLKKFCKFQPESAEIRGNPWIIYPETGFQGRPSVVEEGKYNNMEIFGISNLESVKAVGDDLGQPILACYASSKFKGQEKEVPYVNLEGRTMRTVAVGPAGLWAVAKDNTVWFRSACFGKTAASLGETWSKCQSSPTKLVSVGPNSIWCLDADGHVVVRTEVASSSPAGKNWANVDGDMKCVSVSPAGHVWAVDKQDRVWWRKGAKADSATGSTWKHISCPSAMKLISVGTFGVWGLDVNNEVYFREGTIGDPDECEGSGWAKVDGKFTDISVGSTTVWALGANRDIYYRDGIDDNFGKFWRRIEQEKDDKIVFKQFSVCGETIVCTDKDNNIHYKMKALTDVRAGIATYLFEDSPNFSQCNFPNKASTYQVLNGAWAMYSEPDFQGKISYQFSGDCYSNDPPQQAEQQYKQWSLAFLSARPVRGLKNRTILMKVEPQWKNMKVAMEREPITEYEVTNDTYEPMVCTGPRVMEIEGSVEHNFTIENPQNVPGTHFQGVEFGFPQTEPLEVPVNSGAPVYTGKEFHDLLEAKFIMKDEMSSSKALNKKMMVFLPTSLQGKSKMKVRVYIYKCVIRVPCKIICKVGFMSNYLSGTDEWSDTAMLQSVDRTNVKVEIENSSTNLVRKFSRQATNGGTMSL